MRPRDIKVIDTMLGVPMKEDRSDWFDFFKPLLRDQQSLQQFSMPAQYMFRNIPAAEGVDDLPGWTVGEMDRFGIERALIGYNEGSPLNDIVRDRFADRFIFDMPVDPNGGVDVVRAIRRAHAEVGIKAISVFPSGCVPQVPINDKRMWPIYTLACELDIAVLVNVGVPGPRVPMAPQHVELVDEVCYFFPELRFIMRHGAEPWEALAVKLMLKYPNLYYSTSAFAPKHYPKAIIDYANTRGADKIIYAGYFPMGLSLERIFSDLDQVPFKDHVWPKFLRENAMRALKLD
ncbi:amidohydrolase family protein [Novosphingobium aquimarinum]|uniref:amidohydrolase family protein n=1 Tax=Novosphingobium aquimarinum TaxID=2682494 RepID=UPI0012EB46FE|nr:amidohydrolase family protein [Novosphingobium aquimarinum]